MNPLIYASLIPFLLVSGALASQPSWDEGESFEAFRDEWNEWVESVPEVDSASGPLTQLLERMRDDRYDYVNPETGAHAMDVLGGSRPWNEYWDYREVVFSVYAPEFDELGRIAQRPFFAAPIPTAEDDPDLNEDEPYLPSYWFQQHDLNTNFPIRTAVRYLISDAVYNAFEGRQGLAIERFEAASQLCGFTLELPTELGFMTEVAVRSVLREAIFLSVQYDPDVFSEQQLARLQRLLIHDLATNYTDVWRFEERIAHHDVRLHFESVHFPRTNLELRELYLNDAEMFKSFGLLNDYLEGFDSPDPDVDIPLAKLSDLIAVQSRMVDAMIRDLAASPVTQREPDISKAMRKYLSGRDANRYIPVYVDVALWRLELGFIHRDNYETANQIAALSIYRHRARHGEWPLSLSAIDPEVLPIPAIDYYTGEPLRYTVLNGKPRLWALGTDRDDDGGRLIKHEPGTPNPATEWFALDEWDALSDEEQAKYNGDLMIMD